MEAGGEDFGRRLKSEMQPHSMGVRTMSKEWAAAELRGAWYSLTMGQRWTSVGRYPDSDKAE